MTAHDDVVAAVEAWAIPVLDKYGEFNPFDFDELVAAIPDDVLVRLAKERGVLIGRTLKEWYGDTHIGQTLYRWVES